MKYKQLIIFLIVGIGVLVRFYNFENRIVYGPEQAMSLIVSGNYIREKPSLLGHKYFARETLEGHVLYSGALFNYSLVPLQFLVNHNIALVTSYFTLLNIVTAVTLYFLAKKMFNENIALFSMYIFLFDPLMINHSLFLWNYNYLPLVFLLSLYCLYKYINSKNQKFLFLLGVLSGIGVGLQLLYSIPLTLFLLVVLTVSVVRFTKKDNHKFLNGVLLPSTTFVSGACFGNLPMLIFDLRHDFYQLKTGLNYFTQIMLGGRGEGFSYYHFLYLWIVFAIAGGWLLNKLFKKNVFLGFITAVSYIFISLNTPYVNFRKPTGMPEGLIAEDIYKTSEIISRESEMCSSFNVIETQDFDTRAHILRYPLIFKYHKPPLGIIDYKQSDCVFSLSASDYNFKDADIWEFNELRPFSVDKISDIGSGYSLYKLKHE